jgi:glycosyltransferase involved in cell wall biosynthesis
MRFHVLGVPHAATSTDYLCCAFSQKVLKFCRMMHEAGHTVYHYGNEASDVDCTEHISVVGSDEINSPDDFGGYDTNSPVYQKFNIGAAHEIYKRKKQYDFLILMWPGYQLIVQTHSDLLIVEAGIGYPDGHFAKFKVFESYAMLHAYRGMESVRTANGNNWWYDVVIPNSFDSADFLYSESKNDYLLFMGQRSIGGEGKGIHIAAQIAKETGKKLVVAGPGNINKEQIEFPENTEFTGRVYMKDRAKLMAHAKAVLCPSLFIEPFCGVSIESFFSGTPVISTDWGAFAENNLHGITGYRCRTMEQFAWAVYNIDKIKPSACYDWAMQNFTLERARNMYLEFFDSILHVAMGKGWYQRTARHKLDWLNRPMPKVSV